MDIFQEVENPGEDALRKVKYFQELVSNKKKWQDCEQNQGIKDIGKTFHLKIYKPFEF